MRRQMLLGRRALLLGAGAAGLGACDGREPRKGFLGAMERFNQRVQRAAFDPEALAPTQPESAVTSLDAFPDYFISPNVPLPPPDWRLKVGGMVARPMSFSVEELMRLPRTDIRVRHYCVEGWSAVASWHGVQLREVARLVGADPAAEYVEFQSFDSGYYSSWDRPSALHPQSLLAYGMNGGPLVPGHGAPVRHYAPVKLGYKMVKYLTEIRFLPNITGGYWEDRGYEWFAGV
jgi:DMSO/TMAO reductase YedYZ molybdopterin-dependent catalytic subunit